MSRVRLQKGMVFVYEISQTVRDYIDRLLADPHRPKYHLVSPHSDNDPGDPNGAFFADGKYHLMFLYACAPGKFSWHHLVSVDLLHWTSLGDALTPIDGDNGCFSGGAFVDDDGTAYLTFWKFAAADGSDNGGIDIAYAKPPYTDWQRIRPIAVNGSKAEWGTVDLEIDGEVKHISCADPSNIWKQDGWYYFEAGNLCVLNAYGRSEDSPEEYKGDWTDLFRSKDLKNWEYVHRFYKNEHLGEDWPDATEDDMCPTLLPIFDAPAGGKPTGKHLQTFIAHNKGGQYYVGELDGETFRPEAHGRFSWVDDTCFAPEAMLDGKNRHLIWFWLRHKRDDEYKRFGWTGTFTLPRVLWLENGELRQAPAEELSRLQHNAQIFAVGTVNGETDLPVKNGAQFRLQAEIDLKSAAKAGFAVRVGGGNRMEIYYDAAEHKLVFDATANGEEGKRIHRKEAAPFTLAENETLKLDIFVDHSVIEVFANDRQAISRHVYPSDPAAAVGATAMADGAEFRSVQAWEMASSNPY